MQQQQMDGELNVEENTVEFHVIIVCNSVGYFCDEHLMQNGA